MVPSLALNFKGAFGISVVYEKVAYSMVVLYIKDHGGLGFSAQQYHPKTSLRFPMQQFSSSQAKNVFRLTLNPSNKLL